MLQADPSITPIALKPERHARILRHLEERGSVTVTDLVLAFGVSEATVRRDLEELHRLGRLRRTYGGATRMDRAAREPPILERMHLQREQKLRIGRAAAECIADGETVFIGSGTTALQVARALPPDPRLTVITNSLPVANELADRPRVDLIVVGGMFRASEQSMVGHFAEQAIRELRADQVFMGMRAIHPEHGFGADYLPEILTDRAILGLAPRVVIVADHSKFNRVSSVVMAPVAAANLIITDEDAPPDAVSLLRALGIEVRLA